MSFEITSTLIQVDDLVELATHYIPLSSKDAREALENTLMNMLNSLTPRDIEAIIAGDPKKASTEYHFVPQTMKAIAQYVVPGQIPNLLAAGDTSVSCLYPHVVQAATKWARLLQFPSIHMGSLKGLITDMDEFQTHHKNGTVVYSCRLDTALYTMANSVALLTAARAHRERLSWTDNLTPQTQRLSELLVAIGESGPIKAKGTLARYIQDYMAPFEKQAISVYNSIMEVKKTIGQASGSWPSKCSSGSTEDHARRCQ